MNLEVGMYIRNKNGLILLLDEENITGYKSYIGGSEITKASHNIIDIIEAGDYVNGFMVDRVVEVPNEEIGKVIVTDNSNCDCWEGAPIDFWSGDIKSIVTKEQFESISYKIGD